MPWDVLWDVAWKVGLPFVLVLIAIWSLATGRVVTRYQYDEMKKNYEDQIASEQARSADLWGILRPTLGVATGALDEVQKGRRR